MPAAAPRPTNGASANASDPATSASEPQPDGVTRTRPGPGSRRRAASRTVPADGRGDERRTTIASVSITTWPDSFSSAIRRRVERRRGDELEAAAPRLGGERAGQGEDRPQAATSGKNAAVLVLEVAAQRLDVDRPCRRGPARIGGTAVDEVAELVRATRASRTRRRSPADADQQQDAEETARR